MSRSEVPRLARCECCGAPVIQEVERVGRAPALPIAERARRAIAAEIEGCPEDCWRFFASCWPDDVTRGLWSARKLSSVLAVSPSTLMSRFLRAQLPAPRKYIAWARLVQAAARLDEGGMTWTAAAYDVEASSPQSLGRTLRAEWGIGAVELRERGSDWALGHYVSMLVRPYTDTLLRFRPLAVDPAQRLRLVAA